MQIGNKIFDTAKHTAIMAILNVTPDSFSDGGSYKSMDDVRHRVQQMIKEGAEIIDIGGESTRPGHVQISDDEEIARVVPVVECLKTEEQAWRSGFYLKSGQSGFWYRSCARY